jgi:disulfide bond formation protein DsbB
VKFSLVNLCEFCVDQREDYYFCGTIPGIVQLFSKNTMAEFSFAKTSDTIEKFIPKAKRFNLPILISFVT